MPPRRRQIRTINRELQASGTTGRWIRLVFPTIDLSCRLGSCFRRVGLSDLFATIAIACWQRLFTRKLSRYLARRHSTPGFACRPSGLYRRLVAQRGPRAPRNATVAQGSAPLQLTMPPLLRRALPKHRPWPSAQAEERPTWPSGQSGTASDPSGRRACKLRREGCTMRSGSSPALRRRARAEAAAVT